MIQIKHVTKRFGDYLAVDDVSFEIHEGETFALLGPNGSGKSTMLRCLLGLVVPSHGTISFGDLDLQQNSRQVKQLMSYLPQRVSFPDNLTAREVMAFYSRLRKLSPGRIDQMLLNRRFDFDGFAEKQVCEFSGGMVQRLGLAVACLPDAPILVLDEPTVSLDPGGAIRFREFLMDLKREGKTIVFSSHMLTDVEQLADRVAILVGGKLAAVESIGSLRKALMHQCKMRVVLGNPRMEWIEVARQSGATGVLLQADTLSFNSLAETRLTVLKALEAAGATVARFVTQEPSLEDIYLGYIHGAD